MVVDVTTGAKGRAYVPFASLATTDFLQGMKLLDALSKLGADPVTKHAYVYVPNEEDDRKYVTEKLGEDMVTSLWSQFKLPSVLFQKDHTLSLKVPVKDFNAEVKLEHELMKLGIIGVIANGTTAKTG